jgi:outer membrane protein
MKKRMSVVLGLALVMAIGLATLAHADDYKNFGVRMRAIYVKPSESIDGDLDGHVKLSDSIIPELDLEYFITKQISTELILAVTKHDVKVNGATAGSTWLLPPTLTVKYHPFAGNQISPYVGAGVNLTIPFESELSGAGTKLSIDNSVGWAAQAGVDIKIAENMYFNLDYKYINADTKATIGGTKYDLDINPHLFGIGVGYRF